MILTANKNPAIKMAGFLRLNHYFHSAIEVNYTYADVAFHKDIKRLQ